MSPSESRPERGSSSEAERRRDVPGIPSAEEDERLARATEAFLAESIARERATEPATEVPAPRRPNARSAGPGTIDAGDPRERRERSRRSAPPPAPAEILDGAAWTDVVQREAARWQRHGGSVAVLAVRLARRGTASIVGERVPEPVNVGDPQAAERYAVPLGDVLRHRARASDPVARVATDQFSVLLLEADEAGASAYAERIRAICEPWVNAVPGDLALRIGWAVARLGGSLQLAAEDAYASVASRSG